MSSRSKSSRIQALLGSAVQLIEALKGSKPRVVIFASGFVLLLMAPVLGDLTELLIVAAIAIFVILVIDLVRGGTLND